MAHLFSDSFDNHVDFGSLDTRWLSASASAPNSFLSPQEHTPFNSGKSVALSYYNQRLTATLPTNEAVIYGSLRFYIFGGLAWVMTLQLADGTFDKPQLSIMLNGTGGVDVRNGNNTGNGLGTASNAYFGNGWNSVQFKVVISDTAGEVRIRINGSQTDTVAVTGVNTRGGTGNNYANLFNILSSQNYTIAEGYNAALHVDDVFLCGGSGAAPNTWVPELRAVQQLPAGSTQGQFAVVGAPSNWQAVNESAANDDTNYISASAVGTEDRFSMSSVDAGLFIYGVRYCARWRKSDAGAVSVGLSLNGVTIVTDTGVSTSYRTFSAYEAVNTDGAAFTVASANAAILAVKILA